MIDGLVGSFGPGEFDLTTRNGDGRVQLKNIAKINFHSKNKSISTCSMLLIQLVMLLVMEVELLLVLVNKHCMNILHNDYLFSLKNNSIDYMDKTNFHLKMMKLIWLVFLMLLNNPLEKEN